MQNNEGIHECEFLKGKISDVMLNSINGEIRCRRCGKVIPESQVEEKTLEGIKLKLNQRKEEKKRR